MGKAANELIAVAFNVVDYPLDKSYLSNLTDCVVDYYQKLQQIVKICIEGPDRAEVISFLDQPIGNLISNAPIEGEINQELVNTEGEEYKLQMIYGKIRKLVYYTANSFRALVIQIGSTIYSIVEASGSISDTLVVQLVANITSQLNQIRIFLNNVVTSREFALVIKSNETIKEENINEHSDSFQDENIWNTTNNLPCLNSNDPNYNLGTLNSFVIRLTQTEDEVGM